MRFCSFLCVLAGFFTLVSVNVYAMAGTTSAAVLFLECKKGNLDFANPPTEQNTAILISLKSCISYVSGVSDTLRYIEVLTNKSIYCSPASLTTGQTMDAVISYFEKNPSNITEDITASFVIIQALQQAFPCRMQ